MKKITQVCIGVLFLFAFNLSFSQKNVSCKVVNKELKGEYSGQCKDGLAHGIGNFKFSDGKFVYKGHFKEGKMHGEGEIFTIKGNKIQESISKGVWSENVYVEDEVKDDYVIKTKFNLERYNVRRIGDGNRLLLNFYKNGNRNRVSGLNLYVSSGSRTTGSLSQEWENVEFPVRCQISYRTANKLNTSSYTVRFEIVINKPGEWDIALNN